MGAKEMSASEYIRLKIALMNTTDKTEKKRIKKEMTQLKFKMTGKPVGKFGVDTAAKAKERELAKLIKAELEKEMEHEQTKIEKLRMKNRKIGQTSLGEKSLKHFW